MTCDAGGTDLEALPLSLVELVTPLRFGVAGVGARLSVDLVVPVLETRLADCSSLEPKVDFDDELWGECLLFDAGLALGLGWRSRDEGAGVDGFAGGEGCSTGLGTATVMSVSTRRDCKTFSNNLCV